MNIQKCKRYNFYIGSFLYCLAILGLGSPICAQTQRTWQWVKQLGGPDWDISTGIVIDAKNNLYVAGNYSQILSSDKDKIKSYGGRDIFLAKFDTKGTLENLWSYGGRGFDQVNCIASSIENSIVLAGTITDTVNFGKQKISGSGMRLFVSSTNTKGRVSWVTPIAIEGNASISLIATDKKGTIYAAGVFTGNLACDDKKVVSHGLNDIFLLRMSSSGEIDQLISFGSNDEDIPGSLSINSHGEISLGGSFTKGFSLGQMSVAPGKEKTNLFLAHFSSSFQPLWIKVITAEDHGSIASIRNDASNNLYVAGNFNMHLSLPDTTFSSNGFTDAFVVKYDTLGNRTWAKSIGSDYYDYITGLNIDNIGGVLVTGSIGNSIQIDSITIQTTAAGDGAFIAQFDEKGNALWGDYINGTGRNFSNGSVLDNDGNLYLCGSFQNSFKKDGGELISKGEQDIFLARYYNCPEEKLKFGGDQVLCPGVSTLLYVQNKYKTILWNSTLQNKNYFEVKTPGTYWASIMNKKGCRYSDSIRITQSMPPIYSLGMDTTLLVVDTVVLKAPGQVRNFHWMDESTNAFYIASATDLKPETKQYWITFTDFMGCKWGDTIAIRYVNVPDLADFMHVVLQTYPNPFYEDLRWKIETDRTCRLTVDVIDKLGHLIYSEKQDPYIPGTEQWISFSQIPIGTYTIRIKNCVTGKIYASKTIVKQ